MVFNLAEFGQICMWMLPIVLFFSFFVSGFLGALLQQPTYGRQIVIILSYLFCVGVIVHEVAHQLMCKVFGVEVKEVQYFRVESKKHAEKVHTRIGGYVATGDIGSFTTGIFLGIAPILVNGLLLALLYYYYPVWMETGYEGILIYLGVALGLGARPSGRDLTACWRIFQKHPGRGILEIFFLCGFGVVLYCMALFQIDVWTIFGVVITFIIVCIINGRLKTNTPQQRYRPV